MSNVSAIVPANDDIKAQYDQAMADLRKLNHDLNNKMHALGLSKVLRERLQEDVRELKTLNARLKEENAALTLGLLRAA